MHSMFDQCKGKNSREKHEKQGSGSNEKTALHFCVNSRTLKLFPLHKVIK